MQKKIMIYVMCILLILLAGCHKDVMQEYQDNVQLIIDTSACTEDMTQDIELLQELIEQYVKLTYQIGDHYNPEGVEKYCPTETKDDWIQSAQAKQIYSDIYEIKITDISFQSNQQAEVIVVITAEYQDIQLTEQKEYLFAILMDVIKEDSNWFVGASKRLYCADAEFYVLDRDDLGNTIFRRERYE